MESVASHLDESTGYFVNHWQLLERIERAEHSLDQRIAAAAAHAERLPRPLPQAAVAAADGAEALDFDPEVAAIFTDEATELIEASEQALADWRSQPGSADFRLALKRPLHTLKGGARMAGITPMGDLSHELESLVMLVDTGTRHRGRRRCSMRSRRASMSSRACASRSPPAAAWRRHAR